MTTHLTDVDEDTITLAAFGPDGDRRDTPALLAAVEAVVAARVAAATSRHAWASAERVGADRP